MATETVTLTEMLATDNGDLGPEADAFDVAAYNEALEAVWPEGDVDADVGGKLAEDVLCGRHGDWLAVARAARVESLAEEDAAEWAAEATKDELEQALQPGQLGADEGLINGLGVAGAQKYLGATEETFSAACEAYNAAHQKALARFAARRRASETKTYTILWGHSGTQGAEWTTAQEASRYAAEVWGQVDAESPEEAVAQVRAEAPELVGDWYASGESIHVVPAAV